MKRSGWLEYWLRMTCAPSTTLAPWSSMMPCSLSTFLVLSRTPSTASCTPCTSSSSTFILMLSSTSVSDQINIENDGDNQLNCDSRTVNVLLPNILHSL